MARFLPSALPAQFLALATNALPGFLDFLAFSSLIFNLRTINKSQRIVGANKNDTAGCLFLYSQSGITVIIAVPFKYGNSPKHGANCAYINIGIDKTIITYRVASKINVLMLAQNILRDLHILHLGYH